jgi:hypothetical protein
MYLFAVMPELYNLQSISRLSPHAHHAVRGKLLEARNMTFKGEVLK